MLENTCPKCAAAIGFECTLPNGKATATHDVRNMTRGYGRYATVYKSAVRLIALNGDVSAHDVGEDLDKMRDLTNMSNTLRELTTYGHLVRVGKRGGRFMYALPA